MKKFIVVPLALCALAACKPERDELPQRYQTAEQGVTAETSAPVSPRLDIGDVEACVTIAATVADRSRGTHVAVDDITTMKKTLTMCVATVSPPYPAELWVKVQVNVLKGKGLERRPVALRGAVLRDDSPVQTFGAVIGEEAILTEPARGAQPLPNEFELDVLAGLASPPNTMLVHVRAEAVLLPEGTEPASVDPATATAEPGNMTTLLSNPVRINFVPEAAAP